MSPGQLPFGWLPPPPDSCLPDNSFREKLPPRKVAPRLNAPEENFPPENCPLTIRFPLKIIAPTQANSPQRVLRVNWGKLCILYEYFNIRVVQLRSKNRFTSIYFLQILTKPCRTPLIIQHFTKCLLIFFRQNAKKYNLLEKLIPKKYKIASS